MIEISMPSNIALIKYMGKDGNSQPINGSISYTLENLRTHIKIQPSVTDQDELITQVTLKAGGEAKFLQHFSMLKKHFNIPGCFEIISENNFPSGTGLASSASSYAALTQAAYLLSQKLETSSPAANTHLAKLAQQGSGSSIRSFFTPWCLWRGGEVNATGEKWPILQHEVLLLDSEHKAISSSEAHRRVMSSPRMTHRAERAEERLTNLIQAFDQQNWYEIYQICKDEFLDMHDLFHTSSPSFSYMKPKCSDVIRLTDQFVDSGHQIILTMDAGANMHFLFPEAEHAAFCDLKQEINLNSAWWQA